MGGENEEELSEELKVSVETEEEIEELVIVELDDGLRGGSMETYNFTFIHYVVSIVRFLLTFLRLRSGHQFMTK